MISYVRGNSAIHRIDARIKILWLALFTLALVFVRLPEVALCAAVVNILLLQASGTTPQAFWKEMRGLLFFALLPIPLQVLAVGSVFLGLLNSLILVDILTATFLLISTTKISAITDAMLWLRIPKTLVFSISLAFSFIPLLQQELHEARVAQSVRGGGLRKPASVLPMIIPVFHGIFARARKLSISLEARGFNPDVG